MRMRIFWRNIWFRLAKEDLPQVETTLIMRKSSLGAARVSIGPRRMRNDQPLSSLKRSTSASRLSSGSTHASRSSSVPGRLSFGNSQTGARNSLATRGSSLKRTSGYGHASYSDGPKKDPRPISNQSYMKEEIRKLVEFLIQCGYPHHISLKLLLRPMAKDVLRIFEFLYRLIEPDFNMPSHHEDVIPSIMKKLGYPFTINKSSMFNMASPHTWPTILATISWLRELVQMAFYMGSRIEEKMFPPADDDFDMVPLNKLRYDFLVTTYQKYMAGADKFDEVIEDVKKQLSCRGMLKDADIDKLVSQNERLQNELDSLNNEPDRITMLKNCLSETQCSLQETKNRAEELAIDQAQKDRKLTEAQETEEQLLEELTALMQDMKRKQHILEVQDLSPQDVERINAEHAELQREISAQQERLDATDAQIWEEELKVARTLECVQAKCQAYNNQAMRLNLIPETAANANGDDLELKDICRSKVMTDVSSRIKPALQQHKQNFKERVYETQNQRLSNQEGYDQLSDMVSDRQQELQQWENKVGQCDSELEYKKSSQLQEMKALQAEVEEIEKKSTTMRSQSLMSVQDQEAELLHYHAEAKAIACDMAADEAVYERFLTRTCGLLLDHRESILLALKKYKEKVPSGSMDM
ncbi:PREDICTED: kinetochore protein NDC80 homolog [Priapulus caudatus]|uniref:Kinetochore protein NDC80 n=1 Tax=Priapulus caudatus TaxID=37621 RepID=A0ABM1DVX5_PRICU|nr:PREDICTED: kinetochore protein NDC80 homolog [Priapulus caudatus]